MLYLNHYKRKEVITYAKNERQKKTSQNQYHQRLRIPDRREAGDYCVSEYWRILEVRPYEVQIYAVLLLCNVLGVRISDLFDAVATTEISESRVQYITYDEEKLLECYRELSDKKRELLRIYVDMLRKYEDELLARNDDDYER